MNIYKKINLIRGEMLALPVMKTGNFNGRRFFELPDFLNPAMAICIKHGVCPVVSFPEGVATMTIFDVDAEDPKDPKSQHTITSPFANTDLPKCHPVQNLGASQSYLRRYLWMTFLELAEHDKVEYTEPAAVNENDTECVRLMECIDMESLKQAWSDIYKRNAKDKNRRDALQKIYLGQKEKLLTETEVPLAA
jgi:hypothetical protein